MSDGDPSGMLTKDYAKQCEVNSGIDDAMTGGVVGKNGICPHDSSSVHSQQKPWISAYLTWIINGQKLNSAHDT